MRALSTTEQPLGMQLSEVQHSQDFWQVFGIAAGALLAPLLALRPPPWFPFQGLDQLLSGLLLEQMPQPSPELAFVAPVI